MSAWFVFDPLSGTLIAVAMFAAILMALRHARRDRWLLGALQVPFAALLLAALLLRDDAASTALVVLTAKADPQAVSRAAGQWPIVALPEAPATDGAEQVPDLATALRHYPATAHLHVVGTGLVEHDREAIGTRDVSFDPPSLETEMTRIVKLDRPAVVRAGAWWTVRGRVVNPAKHMIELRDPADRVIATTRLDEHGDFALRAVSRADGPALFNLRVLDGERILQSMPLPVVAHPVPTMRVLLLAAAPSPELKFLRRWALDAGVDLASRITLSPGIAQRRGAPIVDATTLAQLDLLVVDERSWPQLASQQQVLREALDDGLGLLIRITGPVPDRVLRDWRELGIEPLFTASKPRAVRLAGADASDKSVELHAWPVTLRGVGNVALLRDSQGAPLATRRVFGRGRIGVWWLSDSHRLVTRGAREAFATLWSESVSTVARARGETPPTLPQRAVVGQRAVLCAPGGSMRVVAPDGSETRLLRDSQENNCAAFWPGEAGWHQLETDADGDPDAPGAGTAKAHDFHVFARQDIASLIEHETLQATALLQNRDGIPIRRRLDREALRVALLAVWLFFSALLWRQERRARGQGMALH